MNDNEEILNICIKCNVAKKYSDFFRKHDNAKGIENICKECKKVLTKKYDKNRSKNKSVKFKRIKNYEHNFYVKIKLLRGAKSRSVQFNRVCTITVDDIPDPPEYCPVFPWLKLALNKGLPKDNSYTLDRINSNEGYVPGNIQIISFRANTLKSDRTLEEQEYLIKYMREQRTIRQKQFLERIDQIEEEPCQSDIDSHQEILLDQQKSQEKK